MFFLIFNYRRFAPNVSDVSDEFQRLAVQFQEGGMHEFAALCYIGASKCEKALGNQVLEIHLLIKAARSYIKANPDHLCLRSNGEEHLSGALDCYNNAITQLDDLSIIKASIIREMKKINPDCDITTEFVSPAHRAHDLDLAADECIRNDRFESAFEKLTEIRDDIIERKQENLYENVLRKHEITLILLIVLLDLPLARQSPSHLKLYEYFTQNKYPTKTRHSSRMWCAIQSVIMAYKSRAYLLIIEGDIPSLCSIPGVTLSQQIVLQSLKEKCKRLL